MQEISANFLDRSSTKRWIIDDKPAQSGTDHYKQVVAVSTGPGRFESSSARKQGFGCAIVAKVYDSAKVRRGKFKLPANAIQIRFTGIGFVTEETDELIEDFKELFLLPDGSMFITR